jgi:hypothetical protein
MKLEVVEQRNRLFVALRVEEELDLNFELAPTGLRDFEWRVLECFVQDRVSGEGRGTRREVLRVGFAYVSACNLNWTFLMKCVMSAPSTPVTEMVQECVWSAGMPRGRSSGSMGYAILP